MIFLIDWMKTGIAKSIHMTLDIEKYLYKANYIMTYCKMKGY